MYQYAERHNVIGEVTDKRTDASEPYGYVYMRDKSMSKWPGVHNSYYAVAVSNYEEAELVLKNAEDHKDMTGVRWEKTLPRLRNRSDRLTVVDKASASFFFKKPYNQLDRKEREQVDLERRERHDRAFQQQKGTPMTSSTHKTAEYQGWTNYETWAVALWIDNERGDYDFWRERAAEHGKDDVHGLADELKDSFEESMPELQGVYADLMGGAMSEVDWKEIAKHLFDE